MGCGPALDAGPTQQPKVASLLGVASPEVAENYQEPLVVDWRPDQRAGLEAAMREQLPVVRYDGKTLQVLEGCTVEGSYGFIGVAKKQQFIRFETAQEVSANLPLAAAGLGIDLGGGLARGSTLDLGLVIIGKRASVRRFATRKDLQGSCDQATHVVRGALVGAFALKTGTRSSAKVVASLFQADASASSSSRTTVHVKDGVPEQCNTLTPEATRAPRDCGALLRLELLPITAEPPTNPGATVDDLTPVCPLDMVWDGAQCTRSAVVHQCRAGATADCDKQCERGDGKSCKLLANQYQYAQGVEADQARSHALNLRACELGYLPGCASAGAHLYYGEGTEQDRAAAVKLYEQACSGGSAHGCANLGTAYRDGVEKPLDPARAARLFEQSCRGGHANGCSLLGLLYQVGNGVRLDYARAKSLFEKACDAGYGDGCSNLGVLYRFGNGVTRDLITARKLYARACELGSAQGCTNVGWMHYNGQGIRASHEQAASWFQRGCDLYFRASGCIALATLYERGHGVSKDFAKALSLLERSCKDRPGAACRELALRHDQGRLGLPQDRLKAFELFLAACRAGHPLSCTSVAYNYHAGWGVKKSEERALEYYSRACTLGEKHGCFNAGRRYRDGVNVAPDAARAAKLFDKACQLGSGPSCNDLGVLVQFGRGTNRDRTRAEELYAKACELNNKLGCFSSGLSALTGNGVSKNEELGVSRLAKSCELGFMRACQRLRSHFGSKPDGGAELASVYRRSCDKKNHGACVALAELLIDGNLGLQAQPAQAVQLLEKACADGFGRACDLHAQLHLEGRGVKKDPQKAADIRRESCEQHKQGNACFGLAQMHRAGDGVKKTDAEALRFYERGCELKHAPSCELAAQAHADARGTRAPTS